MRHASVEETFGSGTGDNDDDDFNLSILGTVHVLISGVLKLFWKCRKLLRS